MGRPGCQPSFPKGLGNPSKGLAPLGSAKSGEKATRKRKLFWQDFQHTYRRQHPALHATKNVCMNQPGLLGEEVNFFMRDFRRFLAFEGDGELGIFDGD
jgi:hypothetical protein